MADAIPRYAVVPLQRFLDSWKSDFRLLHLSMRGIHVLTGMPGIFETLIEGSDPEEHAELTSNLTEAKKEAELAENECKTGFPLLHAHALVGMWAALEAAIEDMVVGILLNEPDVLKKEDFARVRVSLAEFETRDKEERMRFLIAELGRNLGRKNGVDAFEGLLQYLDLSGDVEDEDRKMIWQTHHLRNVLVHRASRADRRLVEACPWLRLRVNECVTISHEMLGVCAGALGSYVLNVTHRLGKRYAVDTHKLIRKARSVKDSSEKASLDLPESPQE
jgi:hypothetical protein